MRGDFFEIQGELRQEYHHRVCAARRLHRGRSLQPGQLVAAGCLASTPAQGPRGFVRFATRSDIPLLTTGGCAGFLPGVTQGIWRRHQARRETAVCVRPRRPVPKRHGFITRKALRGLRIVGDVFPSTCKAILNYRFADLRGGRDGAKGRWRICVPLPSWAIPKRSPRALDDYDERFAKPVVWR